MHFERLIQSDSSVMRDVIIAYRNMITTTPRRPTHMPYVWTREHHRCTNECNLYQYKDVIICRASGNYHYCTPLTCDRTIEYRDSKVCELTGTSYSLDLVMDTIGRDDACQEQVEYQRYEPAEADDYGDTTSMDAYSHTRSVDATAKVAIAIATSTETDNPYCAPLPTVCEVTQECSSLNIDDEPFDDKAHYNRITCFEDVISAIFVKSKHKIMHLICSIAENAERLWILVHQS